MKWEISSIESISELIQTGKTPPTKKKEYFNGELNWFTPGDLGNDKYLVNSVRTITDAAIKERKAIGFPVGTVLITCIGDIGKVGITSQFCSSNQQITGIKPKSFIYPDYFYYWVVAHKKLLESHSNKAVVPILNNTALKRIKFRYPTLPEQKRIAAILDLVDGLRRKRQQTIDLLDELLRSIFLDMFGKNAVDYKNWKYEKIENLAKPDTNAMRTGPFGSDLLHSEFVDKGIFVVGIDNAVNNRFSWAKKRYITKKKYEKLKRYTLYPGDVLVTIMGTLGKSAVVPDDMPLSINSKHLAAITLNKENVNPYFMSYSIHSDPYIIFQIKNSTRGAIMGGLNLGIIKKLTLKLPPIELQNHFETIFKQTEAVREKMQKSLEEMDNLFHSLMQRAFKGELKLDKVQLDMKAPATEVFDEPSQFENDKSQGMSKADKPKKHFQFLRTELKGETDLTDLSFQDCYKIKEHLQNIKDDKGRPIEFIDFDWDENSTPENIDKLKKFIQQHLEKIKDDKGRTIKIIALDRGSNLERIPFNKLKNTILENLGMTRDDQEKPIEFIDFDWDEDSILQSSPLGSQLKKAIQENLEMILDDKRSRLKVLALDCNKNSTLRSYLSGPIKIDFHETLESINDKVRPIRITGSGGPKKCIHENITLFKDKVQEFLQIIKDDKRSAQILIKHFVIYLYQFFGDTPFTVEDIKEKLKVVTKSYEEILGLIFHLLRDGLNEKGIHLKQCFYDETFDSGNEELNNKLRGTIGFQICENKK